MAMLETAEFRALTPIDAWAIGVDREIVRATGDQILLPGKARHPE
jgi:hypothetical protein